MYSLGMKEVDMSMNVDHSQASIETVMESFFGSRAVPIAELIVPKVGKNQRRKNNREQRKEVDRLKNEQDDQTMKEAIAQHVVHVDVPSPVKIQDKEEEKSETMPTVETVVEKRWDPTAFDEYYASVAEEQQRVNGEFWRQHFASLVPDVESSIDATADEMWPVVSGCLASCRVGQRNSRKPNHGTGSVDSQLTRSLNEDGTVAWESMGLNREEHRRKLIMGVGHIGKLVAYGGDEPRSDTPGVSKAALEPEIPVDAQAESGCIDVAMDAKVGEEVDRMSANDDAPSLQHKPDSDSWFKFLESSSQSYKGKNSLWLANVSENLAEWSDRMIEQSETKTEHEQTSIDTHNNGNADHEAHSGGHGTHCCCNGNVEKKVRFGGHETHWLDNSIDTLSSDCKIGGTPAVRIQVQRSEYIDFQTSYLVGCEFP